VTDPAVTDRAAAGAVFVHEKGLCESTDVGPGTRVWAFAHILAGAKVGSDCNVCDHAYIETGAVVGNRVTVKNRVLIFAGVTVEDDVFLGPAMVFTNDLMPRAAIKKGPDEFLPTIVRQGATIGANATIVCGITIGAHAFIGAGAVVVDDVPAHALVLGNPARFRGWSCTCGRRLGPELACPCGLRFEPAAEGSGLVPLPLPLP
jgi:UDP-2-acetamido-3-amino-2,3-dideoxy-glucuronate N-acetyltransferase